MSLSIRGDSIKLTREHRILTASALNFYANYLLIQATEAKGNKEKGGNDLEAHAAQLLAMAGTAKALAMQIEPETEGG